MNVDAKFEEFPSRCRVQTNGKDRQKDEHENIMSPATAITSEDVYKGIYE